MYRLYKTDCEEQEATYVKESVYRKIFVEKFNLSFHSPKNDTCGKCDKYKILLKTTADDKQKSKIEEQRNVHTDLTKSSYDEKKFDKEKSR